MENRHVANKNRHVINHHRVRRPSGNAVELWHVLGGPTRRRVEHRLELLRKFRAVARGAVEHRLVGALSNARRRPETHRQRGEPRMGEARRINGRRGHVHTRGTQSGRRNRTGFKH